MVHNYRSTHSARPTVSLVGASGYSGLELAKLLMHHSAIEFTHCFTSQAFNLGAEILEPKAKLIQCLPIDQLENNLTDIVFLATPAEVSLKLAPPVLALGKKVIDLSGAFRLKTSDMQTWYGFAQTEPETLALADYGLLPFAQPNSSSLVANPGCYATAVNLALIPLLKHDLIETQGLVIDAKSGTTGAGRKVNENLLFSEVNGECLPYKIGHHQHLPEIQEAVLNYSGTKIAPHFATHLLPISRGIVASVYATAKTTDLSKIKAAFAAEYQNYSLVRHGTQVNQLAKLSKVVGTPFTHISYAINGNKLYVFSLIDNLLKGAASQAIENLNRILDLPATFSLNGEE